MNGQTDNQTSAEHIITGGSEGAQQIIIPLSNVSASSQAPAATSPYVNDVKAFFSKNLIQILKDIFTSPISGTRSLFTNAGNEAYQHGLILIATIVVFFALVPYILIGSQIRSAIGFGTFFKLGLSAGLALVAISALSFGVKAISGKPDFKKELLTGGLCGIPLSLVALDILFFMLANKDGIDFFNPESILQQGAFSGIILLYLALMLFNIIQQSFKAAGTNDALSWYLSPLVICIGFYIGTKIAMSIFGPSGYSPY